MLDFLYFGINLSLKRRRSWLAAAKFQTLSPSLVVRISGQKQFREVPSDGPRREKNHHTWDYIYRDIHTAMQFRYAIFRALFLTPIDSVRFIFIN